nr:helix-turn-helix transcriptional regulator [Nocardia cerradoensis]
MTQTELARRMGTTQPTIARIEGGGRMPTLDMLERLATAVGQRLDISLGPAA